jgi:hypothetical protein
MKNPNVLTRFIMLYTGHGIDEMTLVIQFIGHDWSHYEDPSL